MTHVIKIQKDGKTAEVVDRFVGDFLKDGWSEVDEFEDELGAQSTEEAERIAQEESFKKAQFELEAARKAIYDEEAGQAEIERKKEADELRHSQDAINHSRVNIDHAKNITELETKDDVEAYVKANFNKDLDKRGSLEVIKEKALLISKETH